MHGSPKQQLLKTLRAHVQIRDGSRGEDPLPTACYWRCAAFLARRSEHDYETSIYRPAERDRLKQILVEKLEASGWRDEIKQKTREYVERQRKEGIDEKNLTIDDIVKAVRPQGRWVM